MARKRRIHYPGAIYHVMLRGNAKQTIFHGSAEYRYFEKILEQGLDDHSVILHAYCWMKNHVHMALQVTDKPLSKLMQSLSQRYTRWFNKKYDQVGHLFQGRYKAILVDEHGYLRELIRYIHLNPVRANLVMDPADYLFSSHRAYAGNVQHPSWLMVDQGLGQFGITESTARAAYLHFMGLTPEDSMMDQLRHGNKEGRILGNKNFINNVLKHNNETILKEVTIDQLVDTVSNVYKISALEMTSASRARCPAEARAMTVLIGMDYCGYLLSEIAHYFNRNIGPMSRQVKALRIRITTDRLLSDRIENIKDKITTISQA